MSSKIIILFWLGFVNVFGQTPCSIQHHTLEQKPEPSDVQPKYELAPEASDFLSRDYLPPNDFQPLPLADQPKPVYVAPPVSKQVIQPLPKLQPLPQATYVKPVYQSFPQPASQPRYIQPINPPVQPKLDPPPKFAFQPFPKLQPLKPIVVQPIIPSSTIRPLPVLPKITLSPKQIAPPKSSYQPKENEVQASNTVGVKYDNRFFIKKVDSVPQATNIQPKFIKPDLETAAQTNRLSYANPDGIRINHYICEIGNAEQKFLCDILKLWDIQHPKELNSNDLDNPVENSNFNPQIARLPSSPKPTYTPPPSPVTYTYPTTTTTTTTTTTQAPTTTEKEYENLPGDSQKNENAIYLPPYSTTARPTFAPSTTAQTTVEIPKKVATPPNNNLDLVTPSDTKDSAQYTYTSPITSTTTTLAPPAKEGYDYPKPAIPFPPPTAVPVKEGYDYPKPAIPFSDGAYFPTRVENSFSNIPPSSFGVPSSVFGPTLSLDSNTASLATFSQYPYNVPLPSFSDSLRYQSLSPIVTSTTFSPEYFVKSNTEYQNSPALNYNFQPLNSFTGSPTVTYNGDIFSTISPYTLSSPAPAISYSTPAPFYSYSSQPVSTLAPLLLSKESLALSSNGQLSTKQDASVEKSSEKISTEKPTLTSTTPFNFVSYESVPTAAPFSNNFNSQLFGQQNSYGPLSYSFQPFGQSVTTVSPPSYSFGQSSKDNSISAGQVSSSQTEKSNIISSTENPFFNNFNSQLFGQQNSFGPLSYSFQPFEQSVTTVSPPAYSFSQSSKDNSISAGQVSSSLSQTEKSNVISSTENPFSKNFNSQLFGQQNSFLPSNYIFQPFQQSITTASPLSYSFSQSSENNSILSGQVSSNTVSQTEKSNTISSTEKPTVTPSLSNSLPSNFNYDLYGQYFNSLSPLQYNSISPSVATFPAQRYNPDQSLLESKSNLTSFNYQPIGQTFSSVSPVSYNFQPLGPSSISGQNFNFPPYNSGLSNSQINSASKGLTYDSPSQAPFNFQTLGQSSASSSGPISSLNNPPSTNFQSFSQSSQSFVGPAISSSTSKSGLTFGPNVQSVQNLKDLQATAKTFDLDLRFGSQRDQGQASSSIDDSDSPLSGGGYRKTGSEEKEDISLGNIEILKVKRKL